MDTPVNVRIDNDNLAKLDVYRRKFLRSRSNAINFILSNYLNGITSWEDESE